MAGNAKFESSSSSPEDTGGSTGSYPNGQRGNYPGGVLEKSGSFREGSDGRTFSSGAMSKGNAMTGLPPLSQCLMLDPFTSGDKKCTRSGELRRALGISFGNVSEDSSSGAAHSKPPVTLATDEIKRLRTSIVEGTLKARNRVKRFDESLSRLTKYSQATNTKKQQPNERSGGSNLLKMGTQSHRNSTDLATPKLEERSKNGILNKRARTPIADMRPEGRGSSTPRQHLVMGKDRDISKEGGSELVEEKIRKLPAGGEGWDKKMKRKRSASNALPRSLDGDGEQKRSMHSRLGSDSGTQSSDAHGLRSGSSGGIPKPDITTSPAGSSVRVTPKNEMEKGSLSRELTGMNKDRPLQKGTNKLSMRDENPFNPSSMTKGKASRAPRTGSTAMGNSSPNFSRVSSTSEDWEHPINVNKVHSLAGVNNRKRPLPAESPSPPVAQWVGQRPQKISRNRRTNIVSPTSAHDEVHMSPEDCAPSDFGTKLSSGMNGSLPARNITNSTEQLKLKTDNSSRYSESEETSGAGTRQNGKAISHGEMEETGTDGYQYGSPGGGLHGKKNKIGIKDEIGDGVRRQSRNGRGSSFPRGNMSPLREKSDCPAATKPLLGTRPPDDKSGSKSGRPLKKHSDRKGFTRFGPVPNSSSPDLTVESDDDREELLAAAQLACNASCNACSTSSFWRRMEPLFAVRLEDRSFLAQQMNSAEECEGSPSHMSCLKTNMMNHILPEDASKLQTAHSGEGKCFLDYSLVDSARTGTDSLDQGVNFEKGPNSSTPLYQRVLSALIIEDDFEESEENSFQGSGSFLASLDDPCAVADRIACNGNNPHSRGSSIQIPSHDRSSPMSFQNDLNGSLAIISNTCDNSSFDCQYERMHIDDKLLLELQSIGVYPEKVPDLADGEDDLINQDIIQLKKELYQQTGDKKACLERIHKTVEEQKEVETWDLEQLAMNKLTELAYRKLLATRGINAARMGVSKIPRPMALAFVRRTLARCRRYKDFGKSCFNEPALRDVLFSVPPSGVNSALANGIGPAGSDARIPGLHPAGSDRPDIQNNKVERASVDPYDPLFNLSDHAFAKNGPILNRGKKKEVLLDNVGIATPSGPTSALGPSLLSGAKGKRSERDPGSKSNRPSSTHSPKTKSKPKQKATQMSSHPVYHNGNSNKNILESSKETEPIDLSNLPLPELDSIGELGANEFAGHQDLSSWLNFEDDGLQDFDSMGLDIPMDDLSELNMLL